MATMVHKCTWKSSYFSLRYELDQVQRVILSLHVDTPKVKTNVGFSLNIQF
jgi:hypothetical protein